MVSTMALLQMLSIQSVELDIGHLDDLHGIDAGKDSIEKRDPVDHHLDFADVDSIADVVGMLHEQKNARAEEFLRRDGEYKGQRQEGHSRAGNDLDKAAPEGEKDEDDDEDDRGRPGQRL